MQLPARIRDHMVGAVVGVVLFLLVSEAIYLHSAVAAHTAYINAIIAHLNSGPVS